MHAAREKTRGSMDVVYITLEEYIDKVDVNIRVFNMYAIERSKPKASDDKACISKFFKSITQQPEKYSTIDSFKIMAAVLTMIHGNQKAAGLLLSLYDANKASDASNNLYSLVISNNPSYMPEPLLQNVDNSIISRHRESRQKTETADSWLSEHDKVDNVGYDEDAPLPKALKIYGKMDCRIDYFLPHGFDQSTLPSGMICSLTRSIIREPLILGDGFAYEESTALRSFDDVVNASSVPPEQQKEQFGTALRCVSLKKMIADHVRSIGGTVKWQSVT